jgi:hypothetical protein
MTNNSVAICDCSSSSETQECSTREVVAYGCLNTILLSVKYTKGKKLLFTGFFSVF